MNTPEQTRILIDQLLAAKSPRWSRDALYRQARLSKTSVAHYFKPGTPPKKHLPADVLYAIAEAVGTTVEYLVTGEHPPDRQLRPELAAICRRLQDLPRDQLIRIDGMIAGYLQTVAEPPARDREASGA